jgi:hypothetical protein
MGALARWYYHRLTADPILSWLAAGLLAVVGLLAPFDATVALAAADGIASSVMSSPGRRAIVTIGTGFAVTAAVAAGVTTCRRASLSSGLASLILATIACERLSHFHLLLAGPVAHHLGLHPLGPLNARDLGKLAIEAALLGGCLATALLAKHLARGGTGRTAAALTSQLIVWLTLVSGMLDLAQVLLRGSISSVRPLLETVEVSGELLVFGLAALGFLALARVPHRCRSRSRGRSDRETTRRQLVPCAS